MFSIASLFHQTVKMYKTVKIHLIFRPEAFSFILAPLANPPKEKYSNAKENSD